MPVVHGTVRIISKGYPTNFRCYHRAREPKIEGPIESNLYVLKSVRKYVVLKLRHHTGAKCCDEVTHFFKQVTFLVGFGRTGSEIRASTVLIQYCTTVARYPGFLLKRCIVERTGSTWANLSIEISRQSICRHFMMGDHSVEIMPHDSNTTHGGGGVIGGIPGQGQRKEIYTYTAPWTIFAMAWSHRWGFYFSIYCYIQPRSTWVGSSLVLYFLVRNDGDAAVHSLQGGPEVSFLAFVISIRACLWSCIILGNLILMRWF